MQDLTFIMITLFFGLSISTNCFIVIHKQNYVLDPLWKGLSCILSFGYAFFVTKGIFGVTYSGWNLLDLDPLQKTVWIITIIVIAFLSMWLFSLSGFFQDSADDGTIWIGLILLVFFGTVGYCFLLGVFHEFNLLGS